MRVFLFLSLLIALAAPAAAATTISLGSQDPPDTIPGEDRWQFTYAVSGHSFLQRFEFPVLFDPQLYRTIETPPPMGADWDLLLADVF